MVVLSFIIPFHNGGKYILECLDSLYTQDIPEDNYEVIVVDDCSTDQQSLDILYAYKKRHNNFIILHNERNLRVGGTRNNGIYNARGKYIWLVDQDDKIEPNILFKLLFQCEKNNLDYIVFDYLDFDDTGNVKPKQLITNDTDIITGLEYAYKICNKNIWNNQWDTNVWHQIYNREFLLKHNILFTEISYFDDMIVNLKSLLYAKRMQSIHMPYYHYRYNEKSVLHSEVGHSGRTVFDFSISASVVLLDLSYEIKDVDSYFTEHFIEGASYRANTFTKSLLSLSNAQQRLFYEQVKHHKDWIEKVMPYLTIINKILLTSPWIVFVIHPLIKMYKRLHYEKK